MKDLKRIRSIAYNILSRYEKELGSTRWSTVRKGAVYGVYTGWLHFVVFLIYSVGFIFGSILMSYEGRSEIDISDILVVSDSFEK